LGESVHLGYLYYRLSLWIANPMKVVWGERKVGNSPPTQAKLLFDGSPAVLTVSEGQTNAERTRLVLDNFLDSTSNSTSLSGEGVSDVE